MQKYEEERIAQLQELGLMYNMKENAFIVHDTTIYVPMLDITCDDDKKFNDRLCKLEAHIKSLNLTVE